MITPESLQRYKVDIAEGMTSQGLSKIVVLLLTGESGHELAFALSKVDALQLAEQLYTAGVEIVKE